MSVTLRPQEAWKMLQDAGSIISIEKLKQGIRQQRWSWADYIAVESDGEKEVYIIYAMPFIAWMKERSPFVKEYQLA